MTLKLCSKGHSKLYFPGEMCPACKLRSDVIRIVDQLQLDLKKSQLEVMSMKRKLGDYAVDYLKWKEVVDKLEGCDYGVYEADKM